MPNRIIKETILTSPNFNKLSVEAERHFYRILLIVDDYGCFEATPEVIKGRCYPLQGTILAKDGKDWQNELEKSGIISFWKDEGRIYGVITNFDKHNAKYSVTDDGKVTRHRRKTPEPPKKFKKVFANLCQPLPNPNPNPNPNPKQLHAGSSPAPIPKPKKQKEETNPLLKKTIDHICTTWERKKGLKYPFNGKHAKLIQSQCNRYEPAGVMALWDLFLNSDDPFFVRGGYSIEVFVTSIPKLADLGYKSIKQKYEQKLGFKPVGEILRGVGL